MSRHDEHSIPADLQDVAKRLEAERPQASDLELDRMKLKAMSSSPRGARTPRPGLGQLFRSGRLATLALAIVLMAGGGAVLASSGGPNSGSSHESASKKEYEDDDCGQSQEEKGRNKSKSSVNNVCQSCEKVSSNQVSSNSIKALTNRILSEASGGSSSDCKPQCDKAGSNKTVTTKTNGGSQCPPTCDNKASSKTVTTKGSTTTTGGGDPNCKPRE
jgi:hypothetical protein